MKLPAFLRKLSESKSVLVLRRISGDSMLPAYKNGQLVWGSGRFRSIKPGDVVIIRHKGLEKIKRVKMLEGPRVYVIGDNAMSSTDSRHFGWINRRAVYAKVWRPAGRPV